jgi:hypothetical protein
MPEFKDRLREAPAHDRNCFATKGHRGPHSCYCGVRWDEKDRISVAKKPPRRR